MAAVGQRIRRGKAPVALGIHGCGADFGAVIEDGDGGSRFANAAQRRTGIIGALAIFQWTGFAPDIVVNNQNVRRIRCGQVGRGDVALFADVTG
ncbi:hypothetical protein D3C76_1210370 [compost metagenome]